MATLSSPQVASNISARKLEKGVFTISGEYELSATLASADIIRMVKIPDGVTVLKIDLSLPPEIGSGGAINTPLLFNVGDGVDSNRFAESMSAFGAGNRAIGDANLTKGIQSMPYTYDFSDNDPDGFDTIDIEVIAFSGTGTAVGTLKMTAHCTADYP